MVERCPIKGTGILLEMKDCLKEELNVIG